MQTHFLGQVEYAATLMAMKPYTAERVEFRTQKTAPNDPIFDLKVNMNAREPLWIYEHFPIYTQGLVGKIEHVLNPRSIPVVQTDRGR